MVLQTMLDLMQLTFIKSTTFTGFEAYPHEPMEQGKGKYYRQVPLCAYQVENKKLLDNNFFFLWRWCELRGDTALEVLPPARPTVTKNGHNVEESRGVNRPNVIFNWLFASICSEFGICAIVSAVKAYLIL